MLDVLEYPAQGSAVNPTTGPGPVYNRRTVLGQLANGERPEQVFGPDREKAARELARYLSGIRLDREERLHHALRNTYMLERRHRAYRAGVRFLHEAYYEYNLTTSPNGDVR